MYIIFIYYLKKIVVTFIDSVIKVQALLQRKLMFSLIMPSGVLLYLIFTQFYLLVLHSGQRFN